MSWLYEHVQKPGIPCWTRANRRSIRQTTETAQAQNYFATATPVLLPSIYNIVFYWRDGVNDTDTVNTNGMKNFCEFRTYRAPSRRSLETCGPRSLLSSYLHCYNRYFQLLF